MSEALMENSVETRERFEVDNDMKAEWCISKIRRIQQEQKRETEELDRQMRFYLDQKQMITDKANEEVAFFEEMLRGYFNHRVDEGFAKSTKTKVSYKLPTGDLILKHREPEYERIPEVLVEWAKKNRPDCVKVVESTDWAKLKKDLTVSGKVMVTEDGEIVPGIAVVEREDEFVVEVK